MATTVAGSAKAGGFVLKRVSTGTLSRDNSSFSVQNEENFCIIENVHSYDFHYKFFVNQIDDISGGFEAASTIVFGKNIVVRSVDYPAPYRLYEYGPAE